jgi:protein TonB
VKEVMEWMDAHQHEGAVSSTDDLFSAAARTAVLRAQFSPARIGGRKVRQLIEQPISFQINR